MSTPPGQVPVQVAVKFILLLLLLLLLLLFLLLGHLDPEANARLARVSANSVYVTMSFRLCRPTIVDVLGVFCRSSPALDSPASNRSVIRPSKRSKRSIFRQKVSSRLLMTRGRIVATSSNLV